MPSELNSINMIFSCQAACQIILDPYYLFTTSYLGELVARAFSMSRNPLSLCDTFDQQLASILDKSKLVSLRRAREAHSVYTQRRSYHADRSICLKQTCRSKDAEQK
jgi:hypothetical protein